MKTLKVILIVLFVLAISVLTYIGYYGFFTSLEVKEKVVETEILAYIEMKGPYQNAKHGMDSVYNALVDEFEVETKRGFGIYFDNPQEVEAIKLRSEVGCIIPSIMEDKIPAIEQRFKIKRLTNKKVLSVDFPYKGSMSIFAGIIKAYPALKEYMKEKNLDAKVPMMEVYDVPNKNIEYRALLKE